MTSPAAAAAEDRRRRKLYTQLWFWVRVAIAAGIAKWQGEREDERFQMVLRNPSIVEEATERALRGERVERERFRGRFERERREEVVLPG